jgi:hypothetical protein
LAASREETEGLRRWLDDLEERYEVLSRAALDAVGILGTGGLLLLDRLRGIPDQVEHAVELGICRGAMLAFAAAQLRSGHDLRRLEPGFPEGTMLRERERLADDFAGAAGFITADVSISNLLEKGANPDEAIP